MANSPRAMCFADWPAAMVVVAGSDRAKFLHNLCTADVLKMQVGDHREAFFTNVKGHVLAHALLVCQAEAVVMVVFQRNASPLLAHLDRYLLRDNVTFTPADRPPVLAVAPTLPPPAPALCKFPLLTANSWLLDAAELATLESAGFVSGSDDDFTWWRVASGWPLQGVDFGDHTLPQELSRDTVAISFTKGCYLGQETVARLDALGHVNKQITLIEGQDLAAGTELFAGDKLVGSITSAAESGDRRLGLAMVRRESGGMGTVLRTSQATATVVELRTSE